MDPLADSVLRPLWLDNPARPVPRPPLDGPADTDLLVVGGGFTGLWTALRAVERQPGRRVLLIEGDRLAEHATGRNGGFCEASLTHGEPNGRQRWPEEYDALARLGMRNLDEIGETLATYGIDCGWARGGQLTVATRAHEVEALEPEVPGFLDAATVQELVASPTYLAGRLEADEAAMVDPARLAWGLADAAQALGVRIAEGTRLESLRRTKGGVEATTSGGVVRARDVVLATNVFPSALRRSAWRVVPVYDYVLATEPLTDAQLAALRWDPAHRGRGLGQPVPLLPAHPRPPHPLGRLRRGLPLRPLDRRRATTTAPRPSRTLAGNFAATFPQLAGIRFTHRWSGVIDTCTRFCAFYGLAHRGRTAYAAGFTGLGVGASRFAADVMLDLLAGAAHRADPAADGAARSRCRSRPSPCRGPASRSPPARWSAHDRTGRRNLWLRALDRLGLGFDS